MTDVLLFLRSHLFEMFTCMGAMTIAFKQPKRKHGWGFFMAVLAAAVLCMLLWSAYADRHSVGVAGSLVRYLGWFMLVLVMVYAWLDCRLLTAVFVTTIGYSMQQLGGRLGSAIGAMFEQGRRDPSIGLLFMLLCTFVVFWLTVLFFRKRNSGYSQPIHITNPAQLIITSLALAVMIFIEEISLPMIRSVADPAIAIANYLSSAVFAVVTIILEFNVLQRHDLEQELAITRRILEEERKQYEREKEVVEVINIKCHDLKHQLQAVGQAIPEQEKGQIQQAIRQYDTRVKTGNRALDVVLTMKRMVCEGSDIEFSCMVNGRLLSFIEEADIYSLFGNLLDNAIEETRQLDSGHRFISLSVAQKQQFVLIHAENFLQVVPKMLDGIPQTTKTDTAYHGFGIRSMQIITEKYNGHMMIDINNKVFSMDIMLPMPGA